ncbi:MAG: CpaF family protein [Planctomycetes bacterium]|nr:CpaF family protein [Planctomycetota bacterium]
MGKVNVFERTVEHFLGPIMPFMRDQAVAEIMINRADEIYIEKEGRLIKTEAKFDDEESLLSAVNNVLQYTGKRMSPEHPLIDSRLPDGSRVHVVLAPLCKNGTVMTIRKFAKVMFDADYLTKVGSWTAQSQEYMKICVLAEKNVLVAGGTSSGKTCLLNVLSSFIPAMQRIVVIEDSAELELQQDHVIGLEARSPDRWGKGEVTIRELFKSSLRLRPDRIIIGECRSGEALDIIQAMTSGHAGSMSTLHANTPLDALNRLETLAMMSKVELPLHALRSQIASAIDVIIHVNRFNDGRRGLTEIAEVLSLSDEGRYAVQPMFEYKLADGPDGKLGKGSLVWTGSKSTFLGDPKIRLQKEQVNLCKSIFTEEA